MIHPSYWTDLSNPNGIWHRVSFTSMIAILFTWNWDRWRTYMSYFYILAFSLSRVLCTSVFVYHSISVILRLVRNLCGLRMFMSTCKFLISFAWLNWLLLSLFAKSLENIWSGGNRHKHVCFWLNWVEQIVRTVTNFINCCVIF